MCRRTDERGITTTYTYDALNRPTGRTYSNGDPSVTYSYDQTSYNGLTIANGKGERTGMSDGSGETAWTYDTMGRVLEEERTIGSVTKELYYTYNLDGSPASVTYPSGRKVNYTVSAVGRPWTAVDTTDNITYVGPGNATYWPQGTLDTAGYGSNITYSTSYNNRLWPTLLQGVASSTFFELEPSYNTNGTVSGVTNALTSGRTQSFTYDYLNRILTAKSSATSGTYCWGQTIPTSGGYDRYGNLLTINSSQCLTPGLSVSVNTSGYYNQITNTGFSYDASGNMTQDGPILPPSHTYQWDAESRVKTVDSGTTAKYVYDGDGKRVEKYGVMYYWFSHDGTLLAETDTGGTTQNEYIYFNGVRTAWRNASSGNVYYYFSDQVGTAQTITNSSGVVCYDSDSLLFGGQMIYNSTCAQEFEFAGMQLDSETGNYDTWFRYYEPNLGRWMSPDPLGLAAADVTNPQSLNLYAYALNNPTSLTDPLGLQPCDPFEGSPCPPCDPTTDPDCGSSGPGAGSGQGECELMAPACPPSWPINAPPGPVISIPGPTVTFGMPAATMWSEDPGINIYTPLSPQQVLAMILLPTAQAGCEFGPCMPNPDGNAAVSDPQQVTHPAYATPKWCHDLGVAVSIGVGATTVVSLAAALPTPAAPGLAAGAGTIGLVTALGDYWHRKVCE